MTDTTAALLAAAKKAATIMAVDRERRAQRGEEDTIGTSVLALLRVAITEAEAPPLIVTEAPPPWWGKNSKVRV